MDRQRKDEIISLFRDAMNGLKWSLIIIAAMVLASVFWNSTAAAQTRQTTGIGFFENEIVGSLTIQRYITPVFAFAVQTSTWDDHSNVVLELKTDITQVVNKRKDKYQLDAVAGMGWGHYRFDGPTDHNYHTYNLGLDIYRHFESFSIVISPMVVCRTWQGHIGLHQPAFMITTGISIDI